MALETQWRTPPLVTELCWAGSGHRLLAGEVDLLRGSEVKGDLPEEERWSAAGGLAGYLSSRLI